MKIYHSSNVKVGTPDIKYSRNYLDFGKGFYLTTLHEQAIKYAQRFVRRRQDAWLNVYEYTSETAALIEDGVADLHCRSEKYLATLVWDEMEENK